MITTYSVSLSGIPISLPKNVCDTDLNSCKEFYKKLKEQYPAQNIILYKHTKEEENDS